MIVYELCCDNNHKFEGWFPCKDSFDEQVKGGLVCCPYCNSKNVSKIPMAFFPKIKTKKEKSAIKNEVEIKVIKERVYNLILQHTEDVGTNFADEALKIHYGLIPEKNIRGIASENQEKLLKDEGIDFFKIPVPAKKKPDGKLN